MLVSLTILLTRIVLPLAFATDDTEINSTEVQNPQCKLDDKCLCLSYVFLVLFLPVRSLLMCFRLTSRTLSLITLPQTLRLFYISLRSQAPQQQCSLIVHALWYYTVGIPF